MSFEFRVKSHELGIANNKLRIYTEINIAIRQYLKKIAGEPAVIFL